MQSLLLDTHVVLWWLGDSLRLGNAARREISDPRNQVIVSAVSAWEIAIKKAIGKLVAPDDLLAALKDNGFEELGIASAHALIAGGLPLHHRDPFDRMLIAQAQCEGLTLVTDDAMFEAYDVALLSANR